VLGGILGAAILYVIATGKSDFTSIGDFASNGYGAHSPGGYNMAACLICEIVMTFMFVMVIMGATHKKASGAFAGVAIGLALTLIHLISIPVTNTSVNPARSLAPAIFQGDWAMGQVWLFWLAPIVGAILAGGVYKWLLPNNIPEPETLEPHA
jgi:aquaporin Z